jgi:hypothetical protein
MCYPTAYQPYVYYTKDILQPDISYFNKYNSLFSGLEIFQNLSPVKQEEAKKEGTFLE